ncbi:uncharacterized protein LOC123194752 isoform X2 [Mangifera indica]|uniref:uncharacterized protein LOC123194752 isoform X2 n=1 Tax=Mangifera indica TaxID=29780 RepID=UPI001CFC386A|nr:uncharacterized protein LOC123194752 isoform X2 [Mangifera indica]
MIPRSLQVLGTCATIIVGGFVTLNFASTVTLGALRAVTEAKRKKVAAPCGSCKGKGFYICKLCKGNATIKWSPLYDPIFINPCLCPTCEGNRFSFFLSVVCSCFWSATFIPAIVLVLREVGKIKDMQSTYLPKKNILVISFLFIVVSEV